MKLTRIAAAALAALAALSVSPGGAPISAASAQETIVLDPPRLQPTDLKPGLKVSYTYEYVRELMNALSMKGKAVEGPPLVGFDYPNTLDGEPALTSDRATGVVAFISGYIRFDEPGEHKLEFWSNDGLLVKIGGQTVSRYDARTPCTTPGPTTVVVPEAGWYTLSATFFQRYKTSCLLMKMQRPGDARLNWAPNDIFGYN